MDLFERTPHEKSDNRPLAHRMCPRKLDEFIGQEHIVGEGKLLRRAIEADRISSLIFFGPPGIGKTALAMVIANRTGGEFMRRNAVSSNVADIRKIIKKAQKNSRQYARRTILLLDEIHRFTKSQQDVLLPEVEQGTLTLIGTTTENPYFSVNSALLSRSQIFEFKALSAEDIKKVLSNALKDKKRGLAQKKIFIDEKGLEHIARVSNGDARKALNATEVAALTTEPQKSGKIHITLKDCEESIQKKAIVYDKSGDSHYDTVSAYIKSMRGSDPDAALYWLATMIVSGEDPRFIARRMVICAAEDVGLADPRALMVANSAMQAADFIGFPEAKIPLAEGTLYIACAPKSNSAYNGIDRAVAYVEKERSQEVPDHLKDGHYPGAKDLGRGEGYKYSHSYEGGYVKQEYMREEMNFYEPGALGYEKKIASWLERLKELENEK